MPMEVHYNIMMDRRDERRREASEITMPTLPMTSDATSLVIDGAFITTKLMIILGRK